MSTVKLKEIASLNIGYPFRTSVDRDPQGTLGVIQMKDITEYNQIDLSDVYRVRIKNLSKRHLLQQGDILFRAKGVSNTATLITQDIGDCVASAHLTVIRVNTSKVDPAYVVWYINHPHGQYKLSRFSKGTSLQMVSNAELGELKLDLPPLEKQSAIAKIATLSQREQEFIAKLAQKRQEYIDLVLMQQAKGK